VVWKVTPALHTPLMSVTNAISGVIVVGAMIALGSAKGITLVSVLSFIAIIIASINIFGGFLVTWRMLSMFKK
jgi:NAD(P) transhydrogenase subunit alpha